MENLICGRIAGVRSQHEARIRSNEYGYYALVVRVDFDGEEHVIYGYNARTFKTRKGAEKSIAKYFKNQGW